MCGYAHQSANSDFTEYSFYINHATIQKLVENTNGTNVSTLFKWTNQMWDSSVKIFKREEA